MKAFAPKPNNAALEAQRKSAEAERKKLQEERDVAERNRTDSLERRNKDSLARRRGQRGRSSLITNSGGELGTTDTLGG